LHQKFTVKDKGTMAAEKNWKELALSRRLENKALKARIVEVIDGREKWKEKAMKYHEENTILKKRIEEIKKNLLQIEDL
jgi:adenylate cyclase